MTDGDGGRTRNLVGLGGSGTCTLWARPKVTIGVMGRVSTVVRGAGARVLIGGLSLTMLVGPTSPSALLASSPRFTVVGPLQVPQAFPISIMMFYMPSTSLSVASPGIALSIPVLEGRSVS